MMTAMNPAQLMGIRQLDTIGYPDHNHNPASVGEAQNLFEHALFRGKFGRLKAKLTGRVTHLPDLTTAVSGKRIIPHDKATLAVPLQQIRGSENRSSDFDRDFNPLQAHTKHRWKRVAQARLSDVSLPSVKLIQVGNDYYVRDGHHRISVAKALGQAYIDADVTAWEVISSN